MVRILPYHSRAVVLTLVFAVCSFAAAAKAAAGGMVSLRFHHCVGGEVLKLDYINMSISLGSRFRSPGCGITISNVYLMRADGRQIYLGGYFLVDEEDSSSKDCILRNVPEGSYSG